jgi:hypothetical protein
MHGDLGMQGVRKQPAACLVQGNAGFIAGRFNTQYTHDLFYLTQISRSVEPGRVDVKLSSPLALSSCILPTLIKVPFQNRIGALQSSSNCSKIPHHFEISWR